MTTDAPIHAPAHLRDNLYEQSCAHCGGLVPAHSGTAYLMWSARKGVNAWKTAHGQSTNPDSCMAKIIRGVPAPAPVGPIAAKAVAAANETEALMDRLDKLEALTLPDAETLTPMLRNMAESMTTAIVQDVAVQFTQTVPSMVAELLASARPLVVTVNDRPPVKLERAHLCFEDVLTMVLADTSPLLVGPAGSGKTHLAKQIADAMGRPFYMASRVSSEHKLCGYYHPHNGELIRTPFREAYENGGVFLFDEVDASDADALTAFNAALAGDIADFPDGLIPRHPDFVCIAAGNTYGRGADRVYVGRNQLDGATLDRFQVYEVEYDEALELLLAGNDDWTRHVQRVRKAILTEKVLHVVSPRASIAGAKLLAAGMARAKVEEICIWKGLDKAQRARVEARMGSY